MMIFSYIYTFYRVKKMDLASELCEYTNKLCEYTNKLCEYTNKLCEYTNKFACS